MKASLGIYVHFPWCERKCPYCDFASFENEPDPDGKHDGIDHRGYADALIKELRWRAPLLARYRVESVFFGGGTPSLWHPHELGRVLAAICEHAPLRDDALEVTVECNPISLDREKAEALRAVGVNRLSIGVQSFDQARLRFLGRLHDPTRAREAVKGAISSGMPRVSADLMYAMAVAPGVPQTPEEAVADALEAASLGVRHISAYSLTIEPNTRFGAAARRGQLPLIDDGRMAASFLAVGEALAKQGFERYEISNFALAGERSRHNVGYWQGHDYLGLGCAAYGTISQPGGGALRYRNAPNPARYLEAARLGDFHPHEQEQLSPETQLRERIMLGLRMRDGLALDEAAEALGVDPWPASRREAADTLIAAGRLVQEGGRLRIPAASWLYTDGTAAQLF